LQHFDVNRRHNRLVEIELSATRERQHLELRAKAEAHRVRHHAILADVEYAVAELHTTRRGEVVVAKSDRVVLPFDILEVIVSDCAAETNIVAQHRRYTSLGGDHVLVFLGERVFLQGKRAAGDKHAHAVVEEAVLKAAAHTRELHIAVEHDLS